jgi:DNA-binding MarR family transcriptional regulator
MKSVHPSVIDQEVFLGKSADALNVLIAQQTEILFQHAGIIIPVKSCSLLSTLATLEPASAADLAQALEQSHQLVLQKIPALIQLKLIRRKNDPADARRKLISLTASGRRQLRLLQNLSPKIKDIYAKLYLELGVNLQTVLSRTVHSLLLRPLIERLTVDTSS